MADYATIDEVQAMADEPDSSSTDVWSLLVTSASRLFDKLTNVPDDFYRAYDGTSAASARTFYGDGTAFLQLDPFISSPTPVVTIPGGEYTVEAGDFVVRDGKLIFLNKTRRMSDIEYPPYDRYTGWWDAVAVTVTAKWGFAAIPSDVTYAVCVLALWLWRQRDPAVAITAELPNLQNQQIPTAAQAVIDNYKGKYNRAAVFA